MKFKLNHLLLCNIISIQQGFSSNQEDPAKTLAKIEQESKKIQEQLNNIKITQLEKKEQKTLNKLKEGNKTFLEGTQKALRSFSESSNGSYENVEKQKVEKITYSLFPQMDPTKDIENQNFINRLASTFLSNNHTIVIGGLNFNKDNHKKGKHLYDINVFFEGILKKHDINFLKIVTTYEGYTDIYTIYNKNFVIVKEKLISFSAATIESFNKAGITLISHEEKEVDQEIFQTLSLILTDAKDHFSKNVQKESIINIYINQDKAYNVKIQKLIEEGRILKEDNSKLKLSIGNIHVNHSTGEFERPVISSKSIAQNIDEPDITLKIHDTKQYFGIQSNN